MKKAIFVLSVFFGTSAFAGLPNNTLQTVEDIKASWDACLQDPESSSTAGYSACNLEAYEAADLLLNQTYQGIKAALAPMKGDDEESALVNKQAWARVLKAQRSWLTFRDDNCQMAGATWIGGTGEGPAITSCLATMTLDRVKELQDSGLAFN